jgi:hypothetical protein
VVVRRIRAQLREDVLERAAVAGLRRERFHLGADARDLAQPELVDHIRREAGGREGARKVRVQRITARDVRQPGQFGRGRQIDVDEKRAQIAQRRVDALGDHGTRALAQRSAIRRAHRCGDARKRRVERRTLRLGEEPVELRGQTFHRRARPQQLARDGRAQQRDRVGDGARVRVEPREPALVIRGGVERQLLGVVRVRLHAVARIEREQVRAQLVAVQRVAQLARVQIAVEPARLAERVARDVVQPAEDGTAMAGFVGERRLGPVVPAVVGRPVAVERGRERVAAARIAPVLREQRVELVVRGHGAIHAACFPRRPSRPPRK